MNSDISLEFHTATGNMKANRYRNSIGIRIDNGRGPAASIFFVEKDLYNVYPLTNFISTACSKLAYNDRNPTVDNFISELVINSGYDDHITLTLYNETLVINIRTENDQAQVVFTKADVRILREFTAFLFQQRKAIT